MAYIQKFRKVPNPAWYTMTVVFSLLSICGIIVICVIWHFANQLIYSYGIIIDAGSTSTKIFLYKWPEIASRTNGEVSEVMMSRTSTGISEFMSDPAEASDGIEVCITQDIAPQIPERLRNKSFVYLGATAGMRLIEQRNPKAMKLIFEAVENYLLSTGFRMNNQLKDVQIISGTVEGIAAWITVNYLKGTLQKNVFSSTIGKKLKTTFGALDLGGASTQITFVPDKPSNISSNTSSNTLIRLYGTNYHVYSHSYLCYGKSQAELRMLALLLKNWIEKFNLKTSINTIENPCMQNGDSAIYNLNSIITVPCVTGQYALKNFGYSINLPDAMRKLKISITFNGTGQPELCQLKMKELFNRSICDHVTCGFNNVYQPNLTDKFLAFAGYFNVYKYMKKNSSAPLTYEEFQTRARKYCRQPAPDVDPPVTDQEKEVENWRKWRCFGFLYVFELLTNLGFNSNNWKSITFTNSVNNANLGWSLGYMINKTSMIPIEEPLVNLNLGTFVAILLLCLVFLCFGCMLAIISFKLYRLKFVTSKPSENVSLKPHLHDEHLLNQV